MNQGSECSSVILRDACTKMQTLNFHGTQHKNAAIAAKANEHDKKNNNTTSICTVSNYLASTLWRNAPLFSTATLHPTLLIFSVPIHAYDPCSMSTKNVIPQGASCTLNSLYTLSNPTDSWNDWKKLNDNEIGRFPMEEAMQARMHGISSLTSA